jgi:uncharacterized protein
MANIITMNLPVKDLEASKLFFASLGYGFDTRFADEHAACMVVSDTINAMLLTHEKFSEHVPNGVADTSRVTEVLMAITLDSREEVDALMERALAAGAVEMRAPLDDGFTYSRSYADPDGHIWDVRFVDLDQTCGAD